MTQCWLISQGNSNHAPLFIAFLSMRRTFTLYSSFKNPRIKVLDYMHDSQAFQATSSYQSTSHCNLSSNKLGFPHLPRFNLKYLPKKQFSPNVLKMLIQGEHLLKRLRMLCSLCYQWPLGATTSAKVCRPYVVTLLNRILVFDWYVARLINQSVHPIEICHHDIITMDYVS